MEIKKSREKTYLLIMSLIIIANYISPIEFDKLNIFGNIIDVEDWLINLFFVMSWLYFMWIFMQKNKFPFINLWDNSDYYKHNLIKTSVNHRLKIAKKIIGNKWDENYVVRGLNREEDDGGYYYKSDIYAPDGGGGSKQMTHVRYKLRHLFPFMILSCFYYMAKDEKFIQQGIPWITSLTAAVLLIILFIR